MSSAIRLGGFIPTPERLQSMEAKAYKPPSQEFALPPELELAQKKRDAYNELMGRSVKKQVSERMLDDIAKGKLPLVKDVLVARYGY